MKEFALTINLKDDPQLIEQYKEYHRNVWPEVLACIKSITRDAAGPIARQGGQRREDRCA